MIKLLKFLNSYYQQKFEFPKDATEDTNFLVEAWYIFLGDYDYNLVTTAAKKLVVDKEWPPTPGELVKEIEKLQMPDIEQIIGAEAWGLLQDAIKRYGRYREDELFASLPKRVVKAAKVTGVDTIYNDNSSFMMSRYINTYELMQEHDFERQLLDPSTRKEIERLKRPEVEELVGKVKGDIL